MEMKEKNEYNTFVSSVFFNPDVTFLEWLKVLANGRLLVDIGCGEGTVLRGLHKAGHKKLIGVDPCTDYLSFSKRNREELSDHIHLLPKGVEDPYVHNFLEGIPSKGMVFILCRPCHSNILIMGSFLLAKKLGVDLYYIGLESNIEQDLVDKGISYSIIGHEGSSSDKELVLKLN